MKIPINDQKLVVMWIFCGKHTVDEIAELKQVTAAQVRKWMHAHEKEVLHSIPLKEEGRSSNHDL